MIPYRFLPSAEQELDAAALHYETEREGLGTEFLDELAVVLNRARRFPKIGTRITAPHAARDVRRNLLTRFPYKLIAAVQNDVLIIVAVAASSQHPVYSFPRLAKVKP